MSPQIIVSQQFNHRQRQVGLRIRRNHPHLLQQFLNRSKGLRDLIVLAMENRHVEVEVVAEVHSLKVNLAFFLIEEMIPELVVLRA